MVDQNPSSLLSPTLQRFLAPCCILKLSCHLAIKIILRRQPCVFTWLPLLLFLFLFFLDESFYQLIPYHQIDQTMKSLGLPESKIGPLSTTTVSALSLIIHHSGWPSKCDGKSPARRNLLPKQKYLLKFCCVWVFFGGWGVKFGEMLPAENRK